MDRATRTWIVWDVTSWVLFDAALVALGKACPPVQHIPWWAWTIIGLPVTAGFYMLANRAERRAKRTAARS